MASRCGEGRPFWRNNGLCASTHGQREAGVPRDDNETLRRAGHCNRSMMRLLGSSVAYARTLRIPTSGRRRNPRAERGTRRAIARDGATEREQRSLLSASAAEFARAKRSDVDLGERSERLRRYR